jgi:hypothetical protein
MPRRSMSSAWLALASIRAHNPPLLVPRLGRVARLGKARRTSAWSRHGAPDIVGGDFDQAVEHNIAGEAENVVDYQIDPTDAEWRVIAPHLPKPCTTGRPHARVALPTRSQAFGRMASYFAKGQSVGGRSGFSEIR